VAVVRGDRPALPTDLGLLFALARAAADAAALGFFLVALFIWFAENIGTFARAWTYPGQETGWEPVSLAKLGSWYLLMIISFVLVSLIHRPRDASQPGDDLA
jgi:uncharacterized membrane protein YoaT (DUF817 family)